MLLSLSLLDPPAPESPVASQLLEAIRAKEPTEKLGEILDSLSSIDPDSEFLDILSLTCSTISTAVVYFIFFRKDSEVSVNVSSILRI